MLAHAKAVGWGVCYSLAVFYLAWFVYSAGGAVMFWATH